MTRALSFWILVALTGCTSSSHRPPSLDAYLPEGPFVDEFRFFHGGGPWPRFIYAFHLSSYEITVARKGTPTPTVYTIKVGDCPPLSRGIEKLRDAVQSDHRIAAGLVPGKPLDEVILDGPVYELEFYSREMFGSVSFEAGSNSQRVVAWIDAALEIRSIEENCRGLQ